MDRALEYLRGAELALSNELYNVCAVCCYYAMFWAATEALRHQGLKPTEWSHGGLRKRFTNELVKRRHIYPAVFGSWLTDGYELKGRANYKAEGAGVKETRRLTNHTREFVTKVQEVIAK